MRKCNPPNKRNAKDPTHCNTCEVKFTKDNTHRNLGYLNRKCKPCLSKENTKRQRESQRKIVEARWF